MKAIIIDERMRKKEKEIIEQMGYKVIEIRKSQKIYEEISAHVDIFACKIGNKIIVEPSQYKEISKQIEVEKGKEEITEKYPEDIKYNVCIIGKKAIHKLDNTDSKIKEELIKGGYELINTKQGYTKCSIAVIDEKSAIVADKGLYKTLKENKIDVLYLDYIPDIKLLKKDGYSEKNGFIGGAMARIEDKIIIFGDLEKIDKNNQIRDFILRRNLKIIDFKNEDVIDYGGIIVFQSICDLEGI